MIHEKTSRAWSQGLQHASDLLIRRGTAMGPLVPMLFLVPIFLGCAYLFSGTPWISAILVLAAMGMVIEYLRQFSNFAKTDPDRLQSEECRYEMRKIQVVAAKELSTPVPLNELNLTDPISNPSNPMPALESVNLHRQLSKGEAE